MLNAYEYPGEAFKDGVLIISSIREGESGVMSIYAFNQLQLSGKGGRSIHLRLWRGQHIAAAQESAEWDDEMRRREPNDRVGHATFMPYGFDELDITPTSNGSRFLSLTRAWSVDLLYTETLADWSDAIIIEDAEGLSDYLGELLPRMGVPVDDVEGIRAAILSKLTKRERVQ